MTTMEIFFESGKKVNASFNGFTIKTDQSVHSGGEGSAPEPFALFLASLGTCAGIFVKSFCDQRDIPTEQIKLYQHMEFNPEKKIMGKIDIEINVPASFPEKYESAVINAASLCLVKRHLSNEIAFNVYVKRN
jgi:putative redox protein